MGSGRGDVTISTEVKKTTLTSGIRWSAATQVGVQAGRVVLFIVLARLLSVADFGVVSVVMIVIAFVDIALGDVGTAAVIVQRQDLTDRQISSLFWFNVGVGIASTGLAQFGAPLFGSVIDHPDAVLALRVVALSFTIAALRMVHLAVLRRDLRYRALAVLDVVSFSVNFLVAVGLAIAGAGLWSLVVGALAGGVTLTLGSWLVSGFRPSFSYSWSHLGSVASFSLNLSAFRFVNFFSRQGDRFLIGVYLGVDAAGFYSAANRLTRYPLDPTVVVYRRVFVPAMSKQKDDTERLRTTFLRSTGAIAVIVVPPTLLSAVLAEPMILALVGEKWLSVVPLVRLLAVVGLLQSAAGQAGVLLQIKGRADLLLYWGIFSGVLSVSAYAVGLNWGVEGVAWAYALVTAFMTIPSFIMPMRVINTELRRVWFVLRGVVVAGAALTAAAYGALRILDGTGANPWVQLIVGSLAGGLAYLAVLLAGRNRALLDLVELGSPGLANRIERRVYRVRP